MEAAQIGNERLIERGLKRILSLKTNPESEIGNLGDAIGTNCVMNVQEQIQNWPLIDTGQLHDAITYIIED